MANQEPKMIKSIVGMYFHTFDNDRYVVYQWRIIGKENDFYIVQFYEWITGGESNIGILKSDFISEPLRVNLYKTREEMNYWYKYKVRKLDKE